MDALIELRELLPPALGFSRAVVGGRSRTLVLTDGSGSWGFSRRFVAFMADPGMISVRDSRNHSGTEERLQLTRSTPGGIL
jgi:hypothetical protein